jgi:hypothetical protein
MLMRCFDEKIEKMRTFYICIKAFGYPQDRYPFIKGHISQLIIQVSAANQMNAPAVFVMLSAVH